MGVPPSQPLEAPHSADMGVKEPMLKGEAQSECSVTLGRCEVLGQDVPAGTTPSAEIRAGRQGCSGTGGGGLAW